MRVTTRGQVTIPAQIREYLNLVPHADVDFRITGGTVVLVKHENGGEPGRKLAALRGLLKGTRTTREWMEATRGA
jgi:AbrB family looped-hinge helix DNA binding protein